MNNNLLLSLYLLIACFSLSAQDANYANNIAGSHLERGGKSDLKISEVIPASQNGEVLFFIVDLQPSGFVIVTADENLPAVLAYSYQDNFPAEGEIFEFIKYDVSLRLQSIPFLPEEVITKRKAERAKLINGSYSKDIQSEQWPADGTTPTGGWLLSNWTQNSPYNLMCPMDPVTHARSYTGCPATAMAMILNFHHTSNGTRFDDEDDYYHSYAGRNYYIDTDWEANGFPSFPDLNLYLDTLDDHYLNDIALTNNDKAALTFACGVAATQVFTSEGSGTFGVNQAYDAYLRFACEDVVLLEEADTNWKTLLSHNMMDTLPAHLALVDPAWSTGHNVVVDGFNTDGYFHVNFGWGGSYNGWYILPDEMPYSLTVLEGVIIDIMKGTSVKTNQVVGENTLKIYPNPAGNFISLNKECENSTMRIISSNGVIVMEKQLTSDISKIDISSLTAGLYFVKIFGEKSYSGKIVVVE